ncbi:hypothetical protein ACHAXT_005948 [Thalassiosira profunda]
MRLENNHLTDNDARSIANGLKRNTNLMELHLGGNEFTDVGYDALRRAIFDPSSFASIADCNHTCCLENMDCSLDATQDNEQSTPDENMRMKMYALLSARNMDGTNVHLLGAELGDDALKLMPGVFSRIKSSAKVAYPEGDDAELPEVNGGHVVPLSIFYELLRNWKEPPLLGLV